MRWAALAFQKCNCEAANQRNFPRNINFLLTATLLLNARKYISTAPADEREKRQKIKQTKYFIQYLKKLQFRNNKYNFKYCHNITCYLIMMIQNGWLNVFENFRFCRCQDLLIKYDSWSNSFQQCPKCVFSWWSRRCPETVKAVSQKKSTINAQ